MCIIFCIVFSLYTKTLFYSLQFCVSESASLKVLSEGKTIKQSQTKSANLIPKQVEESGNYLNASRLLNIFWPNNVFLHKCLHRCNL